LIAVAVLMLFGARGAEAIVYQGFGTTTPGGTQGTVVHVTTLAESGPGSLREAVKQGGRFVVFDIAGEINLTSEIDVRGAFITIDGFSAPPPGITLVNDGLRIDGTKGAHDLIVQGLRVRQPIGDGITISDAAYNVVISHCSLQGASDGSIDITENSSDVTVQWSILAENVPSHNFLSLANSQALRVTFHHNLFIRGQSRNPYVGWDATLTTTPPDTVADVRNNLVWEFLEYGTQIFDNATANVVGNLYYSALQPTAGRALRVSQGKVYAQGNFSLNGVDVDSRGNTENPFFADPVDMSDACTAAQQIVAGAGVRPPDAIDQQYLSGVALPSAPCGSTTPPSTGSGKKTGKKKKKGT